LYNAWLHRYTLVVAICTLFLVVAGGLVTSNDAGLSVPDWPLSYGKLMPPMEGGIFFEHGHRMVATAVGMLTIVLAVWLWRAEPRRWLRRLGFIALAAVIAQGLLGGATVIFMLPKPVSISHACLAQLFFAALVAIAVTTSPAWSRGPELVSDYGWPSNRSLAILTPVLVLLQIALGAAFRQKALTLLPHVLGAMFVALVILLESIFVLQQFPTHRALRPAAKTLLGKISERKHVLLVVERADEAAWLSARNLPQVHLLEPGQLNTYDVLVSDDVVFTKAAFESFVSGPKADETEGSDA